MWCRVAFSVVIMLQRLPQSLCSPPVATDVSTTEDTAANKTLIQTDRDDVTTIALVDMHIGLESILSSVSALESRLAVIQEAQTVAAVRQQAMAEQLQAIEVAVRRWPRRMLGDPCLTGSDCHITEADAHHAVECNEGTCACAAGYRRVPDSRWQCELLRRLSEPCETDAQCGVNMMCNNFVCNCLPQFWNNNNVECRASRQLGESCSDQRDCSSHNPAAICSSLRAVCECAPVRRSFHQYRLAGGTACHHGRVQFMLFRKWFGICNENWHPRVAEVMCHSLGFLGGGVSRADLPAAGTAAADGDVGYVTSVRCDGNERDLSECTIRGRRSTCPEGWVIAVTCSR